MRAFWLLVLAPLALAGYLAVRVSTDGDELRVHEVQSLLDGRLADVRTRASAATAAIERDLVERLATAPTDPDELRALRRSIPLAAEIFREDKDGRLIFPPPGKAQVMVASVDPTMTLERAKKRDEVRAAPVHAMAAESKAAPAAKAAAPAAAPPVAEASAAEREFLQRTQSIWTGQAILPGANPTPAHHVSRRGAKGLGDNLVDVAGTTDHGWLTWYWAEGVHLLFWKRAADGGVIGVELERIGVMSRIVGALPTTALEDGRMELADSRGDTVHQWGPMIPKDGAAKVAPDAQVALDAPLDSWQLRYFISPTQRTALVATNHTGLWLGLAAAGVALVALAWFVYRAYTRRLRDAADRVSFVTRVSHELRTPLTNIRMYAELAEQGTEDEDQLRRLRVVVGETERLGRLIDNVLAFARHQRGTLAVPATSRVDVDSAVRDAVAKFEPALASKQIAVELVLANPPAARGDSDTVDQIVTNLLSNVEKYAAGGQVTITTRADADRVVIGVADHGPGIAPAERAKIFEPFHRVSNSITSSSGTGIGLAIARELARAAGGDLTLADGSSGARFELSLPVAGEAP